MGDKGFTLIELIFVVVLIAILMAVSVPKYADLKTQAQNAVANSILGALNSTETIIYLKSKLDNSVSYNCTTVSSNVTVTGIDSWNVSCGDNKATGIIGGTSYVFLRDVTKMPASWTSTH
jgi:prepilin-type N-terminal cleavage/methylation domain-containing protein